MKLLNSSLLIFLLLALIQGLWAYEVPRARFDVYNRGFDVYIRHEPGITLFAFHAKKNEPMNGLEAGTWSRDITRPTNGFWVFSDRSERLRKGDVIYYWTYVLKDGLGYREDNGVYYV